MALTKITANVIEAGAISTASLADTSITADKLAATLDLTGKAITVATASAGDNDTTVASTAFVTTAIANLTDSAPAALDTLNELAAALNDDADFSTTVTNSIATKLPLAGGTLTGNLNFGDSDKAIFGAGSDLQIYHDSINSIIEDAGTGHVQVRSGTFTVGNAAMTKVSAVFNSGTSQDFYYNNVKKFETTSTGIDVTGTATMDGLTVNSGATDQVALFESTDQFADLALKDSGGTSYIRQSNGSLILEADRANASSNSVAIIKVDNSEKMRLDSTGVGIGTTSPFAKLHVGSRGSASVLSYGSSSDGIVFDFYNLAGSPYTRYANIVSSSSDTSESRLGLWTQAASGTSSEKLTILGDGKVGIGQTSPQAGLDLGSSAKGTWSSGNTYHIPSGNAYIKVQGTAAQDNWIGITGGYDQSSGSANLLLQANIRLVNEQAGNYISSEAQSSTSADITFGKMVGGSTTSGNSTKSEFMRIDSSGRLLVGLTGASGFGTVETDTLTTTGQCILARTGGNVGIGTTSPTAVGNYKVLQLRGNSTTNGGMIRLETSNGTSGVARFYAGSGSTVLESNSNTPLTFGTNATTRMTIDTSGNVGIGTTDIDAVLHVKDDAAANDNFDVLIEGFRPNLVFEDISSSATDFQLFVDSNRLDFLYGDASTDTKLANTAMSIDNSGNVGIGTDSPAAVLHISKDVGNTELEALRLSNFDPDQPNNQIGHAVSLSFELPANDGGNTDGKLAAKIVGLTGANLTNDWYTNSASTNFQGQLDFYTRNDDVLTNQMTLNENGFLGIGTTNPSVKLHLHSTVEEVLRIDSGDTGAIHFFENSTRRGIIGYSNGSSILSNASAGDMTIRAESGKNIHLGISGTSYVTVKPNGEFMVGTTNLFGGGNKTTAFFGAKSDANLRLLSANNSGYACLVIHNTGLNTVGSITQNGSNASFNTSSDYRLKENVDYTWDATTRFKQLKPARFNWIRDETNTLQDGFLAHEVEDIVPEAVKGTKDEVKDTISNVVLNASSVKIDEDITEEEWIAGKEDGTYESDTAWVASYAEPMYQQIDHSKLVPLLVKTIQELEARITALES